jgi:hypothetical protein
MPFGVLFACLAWVFTWHRSEPLMRTDHTYLRLAKAAPRPVLSAHNGGYLKSSVHNAW